MNAPKPAVNLNLQLANAETWIKKWFRVLMREFDEEGLKHRAMSLVYTTLLSLAPLLAVSFSILKGFGVHNQIQPFLREILKPLGEKAGEITSNIVAFVENLQLGVLGFVGFLLLFYTVISLVDQIESCFNYIWRITKPRSLYRRFSDYLSIILIGPVLLFSALGIAASMGSNEIVQNLISLEPFGTVYYGLGLVLPFILEVAAFSFVYSFIPNTQVRLLPALAGGLFTGLAWKGTGLLFALFMANSSQYSAIYSGFAVILLSMIWLYISWLILLLGGVVAFHVQYPRYLNYSSRRPHLSLISQEQLSLILMYMIGNQQVTDQADTTLQNLADNLNLPWEPVADVLDCLKGAGLIVTVEGEPKTYRLARDSDAIRLKDIVQTIRDSGDRTWFNLPDNEAGNLGVLLAALSESPAGIFGLSTLRELIQQKTSGTG
jgi:membrane protein